MKCLVVDDEPLALELISAYISKVEGLTLVKGCANAIEAFTLLQHKQVDLLFLDIQMPQISGLDLLKSLKVKPHVILTTAYREYASYAFDLDVLDYLVKPIHFDRFLQALSKVYRFQSLSTENSHQSPAPFQQPGDAYIYLKEEREMVKIYLSDILYIESLRDYVRVKTLTRQVITYQKISYLEQKLPEHKFIRVHRSFIVAIDKIVSFTPTSVKIQNGDIPIGRNYKLQAMKALNQHNILL
jgi:DNA-binding LytR/AlgR family response regulator